MATTSICMKEPISTSYIGHEALPINASNQISVLVIVSARVRSSRLHLPSVRTYSPPSKARPSTLCVIMLLDYPQLGHKLVFFTDTRQ